MSVLSQYFTGCNQMMIIGDKEGNAPLPDQMKVGDVEFFWGVTGGVGAKSPISTFQ